MGHEVPDDIHVGADRTQVRTGEGKVLELAERPGTDHFLQMVDAGVVAEDVSDHQDQVPLLRKITQVARVLDVGRHRFFNEAVFAGLQFGTSHLIMAGGVRRDNDGVDVRPGPQLRNLAARAQSGGAPLSLAQPVGADVAGGHHPAAVQL